MTAGTLKLLVEALYTGKVKLTGKSQLKNFEDALTCLNSFGNLLNLRPVTLPRSTDYDEEEDEIVLDISFAPTEDKDEDLDEELRKLEQKLAWKIRRLPQDARDREYRNFFYLVHFFGHMVPPVILESFS